MDYQGNIPYSYAAHGPFTLIASPFQLAQLQVCLFLYNMYILVFLSNHDLVRILCSLKKML